MKRLSGNYSWRLVGLALLLALLTQPALAQGRLPPLGTLDPRLAEGDDRNSDPNLPEVGHGILYYPEIISDTRDTARWRIYISSAEQDPPSSVIVMIYDDSPDLYKSAVVDVMVELGYFDDAKNFMLENRTIVKDIPIEKGYNRVPVYIHNDKGEVVRTRLLAVRPKTPIEPFSSTD